MTDGEDGKVVPIRSGSGLQPDGSWVPVFEGQRPPFPPGHALSLRHGAYSDRVVSPIARHLVEAVLEHAGRPGSATSYLLDESYAPALAAWGEAEARAELFAGQLAAHAEECASGCKRCAGWDDKLRRWQVTAMNHRQRLGLDPLSRARLGRDVAAGSVSMAQLMAEEWGRMQEEGDGADG
jgi:hypothetical protein